MKFGYFTLSDNRYPNNPRTPEQFVREIFQQALHAEKIGLNSAWIGEHHFNLLGVNPCPNMLLAQLAGAKDEATRLQLQKQLDEEREKQKAMQRGGGGPRPAAGGGNATPSKPCNCTPGDPLCSCL